MVWVRCWRVWGSSFGDVQEDLGSIIEIFQEGSVHNVNSMFEHDGPGSGWAGGVTRSVKNLKIFFRCRLHKSVNLEIYVDIRI